MSKKQSIFLRFQKNCETSDDHFDNQLKSHYYKSSFDKVFTAAQELFEKNPNMKVNSTSKDRGEIAVSMTNSPHAFIVATVIQVRPFQTAVDFMVSSEKFSIIGLYPTLKKVILQLYSELDKQLPKAEK
ncbi:hypothetical protein [Bacillus andreraoultii]|uniref:hypothetical protein n=1 Tax=Bacillus andreraoultii TaxID=1499685 RepID=UPI00067F15CD|nr:hypothetical protein [Bacillus andreraoultii]